ncbi:MAG: radical SAM protein [Methanocorpusculum sp.]|nr:radical SAM protein [Methanocorpusculum sp.]
MKEGSLASVKADLLFAGRARVTGRELKTPAHISHAGPGTGSAKTLFFTDGISRVRLTADSEGEIEIENDNGSARLMFRDTVVRGRLEEAPCHCPKQAYITLSEGCIFACRYCKVPSLEPHIKSADEVCALVREAAGAGAECISLTSGVLGSPEEDAERLYALLPRLKMFGLPIGVSVYPVPGMPEKLYALGVSEVKFNLEAATAGLFHEMCPGLGREEILAALRRSVELFGRGRVYTNIILGLGETDEEMKTCLRACAGEGIIPILRPLTPSAELAGFPHPSAERMRAMAEFLRDELVKNGLHPDAALTMCAKCTACDVAPKRDV